jgi:hypothetical protein
MKVRIHELQHVPNLAWGLTRAGWEVKLEGGGRLTASNPSMGGWQARRSLWDLGLLTSSRLRISFEHSSPSTTASTVRPCSRAAKPPQTAAR